MMNYGFSIFKKLFIALFVAFMTVPAIPASAQNNDGQITDGREYWLGIPHCLRDRSEPVRWGIYPIELWLSSKVPTNVYIESKDGSFVKNVKLDQPHEVVVVEMPDHLENLESEVVTDKGIHLTGDNPFSVAVFVAYKWSGEAYRVTPVEWLGKKYFTLNMYQDNVKMRSGYNEWKPAQILVVATEDRTDVSYTPSAETESGVKKGNTRSVKLNKGDTYLIEAKIFEYLNQDWATDLSGSKITANKPIAVISGHTKGAFPRFSVTMYGIKTDFMRNMLADMMWPVSLLGKEYISAPVKYKDRTYNDGNMVENLEGDIIRFVATEDETQISQMRADGSSLKQISPTLKEGEVFDILSQTEPGYYIANKKILVGQYGKAWWSRAVNPANPPEKDDDEVQNPPRNGQGMMFCLTPIEQWCSYASFRSPGAMDNFVYVTFKSDDTRKLYFDGQSFYAKFGMAVRNIPGTEYSFVTEEIGAGSHYIEADSGVTFAGYAYGNWDAAKDGFAYGYPVGINFAIQCEDSLVVTDTMICGNVVGTAIALPEDSSCAKIFRIDIYNEENYEWHVDEFDPEEDQVVNYYLDVIDIKQPAKATVEVKTRSGKTIIREYEYIPEQIGYDPEQLDFGLLQIDQTVCEDLTLSNPGEVETVVDSLYLKYNEEEFKIDISGLPVTIPPGGEVKVEVCATALKLRSDDIVDSVYAVLSCFEEPLGELRFRMSEPIVWIGDANWGQVPVGTEKSRPVIIENRSDFEVELNTIVWDDKTHFLRVEDLEFPLKLAPMGESGDDHQFTVWYKPDVAGQQDIDTAWFTGNTEKDKLWSEWVGEGIEAGPEILGHDWMKRRVIDEFNDSTEYEWTVRVNNSGNTKLNVESVEIENDPHGVFRLDKSNLPNQLNPNEPVYLKAYFAPKEGDGIAEYTSDVVFTASFNGEILTASDILHGIELQPHIDIEGNDFGPAVLVGTQVPGFGMIKAPMPEDAPEPQDNMTAMDLTITNIQISNDNKDAFEIDPQFFIDNPYPITLKPGAELPVPITFTATGVGDHIALLETTHAGDDAPENPVDTLIGRGQTVGIGATDHNFFQHFITTRDQGVVYFVNNGSVDAVIEEALTIDGTDREFFSILSWEIEGKPATKDQLPIVVEQGERLQVDVQFAPLEVRPYEAQIDYHTTEVGDETSMLWGEGKDHHVVIWIEDDYTAEPGDILDIDVKMKNADSETKALLDTEIEQFKVIVTFAGASNQDAYEVYPILDSKADIITDNTMTDGFSVTEARIIDRQHLFVELEAPGGAFLDTESHNVLFRFKLFVGLAEKNVIDLPVDFEIVGLPNGYVFEQEIPGKIIIAPVCVNDLRMVQITGVPFEKVRLSPHPVSTTAEVTYQVGIEGHTTISIYDSFGKEVKTLIDGNLKHGKYTFELDVNALDIPSGVYYVKMTSGVFEGTTKFVVTK